jgi:hypothetical protein
MTTVEFVLQAIRKGGFSINLGGKDSQANFTVSDDPKKQSGE